ncbi:MAG: hypothetical protein J2P22_06045 [Nocardioides sp.]|nr:hypothetical protein [Nocardioides sp.]
MHLLTKLGAASATVAVVAAAAVGMPSASAAQHSSLPVKNLSAQSAKFTEMGGATPLATDKTVAHWSGTFTDPTNGVTYGYNMVGVDPATNGSTTTPTDVIPLNLVFSANNGYAMDGTDVVDRTVSSPIFQTGDYSTTAKSGDYQSDTGGGVLSAGNDGVQYEDAIMRSQFNKVGSSYHVRLGQPTVHAPVTLSVPSSKGSAFVTSHGIVYGLTDATWFSGRVSQLLGQLHIDPTHLPIFLTNNVMLYIGSLDNCCIIGYHGASVVNGSGGGPTNGNGRQGVQTFAYAAYTAPGTFGNGQGGPDPFLRDIHALSHEIAEWGDDPFVNNTVDPWLTPTAPQYGCTSLLETGDPVVGIGFTMPGNTYDSANPFADGYFHPEDEVFLPWFARQDPNTTSQLTQSGNGGRYTFMGDLNPYPGFRMPATGC